MNAPPVAINDAGTTAQGQPVAISVTGNDSDPDGSLDLSSLALVSRPSNGVVAILAGGTISYVPNPDFAGSDTFSYRICDDAGDCTVGVVFVDVSGVEVLAPPPVEQTPPPEQVDTVPTVGCAATGIDAESFEIEPEFGAVGTAVELRLEVADRGLADCLPPEVRFLFDGALLDGPVALSSNPGASGAGEVPDVSPGTYRVTVETVTDPPVELAARDFEVLGGGGDGGILDALPPAPVTVPVAAVGAGLLIIGAAILRRRYRDKRHPPLDPLPLDDDDQLVVQAVALAHAAVDARLTADAAVARAAEARAAAAAARGALASGSGPDWAAAYHLLANPNPNAPSRADGRRGWFHPTAGRTVSGIVVCADASSGSAAAAAEHYATRGDERSVHAVADADGVVELLPDEYVAVRAAGSDNLTLTIELVHPSGSADDDRRTVEHAASWIAEKAHLHQIPVRRLSRAEWTAGTSGLLDGADVDEAAAASTDDGGALWPALLAATKQAQDETRDVARRTVTGGVAAAVTDDVAIAARRAADDAERVALDAESAAVEADRLAAEAEARADAGADPWWDRAARVPRHQVPTAPGTDEPERRREAYYLLDYENPAAEEAEDGRRGWYLAGRDEAIAGIVVHTTQTEGAPEVADFYATSEHPVSAHVVVDDHGWVKLLPDEYVAYHANGADHALGVEIAYRAKDWGEDPIREDALLRMAAAWCAVRVRRHDVPVRELTVEQWKAGERGFVGHGTIDWRHDDPGDDFPWERFLALVATMAGVGDRTSA